MGNGWFRSRQVPKWEKGKWGKDTGKGRNLRELCRKVFGVIFPVARITAEGSCYQHHVPSPQIVEMELCALLSREKKTFGWFNNLSSNLVELCFTNVAFLSILT